MPRMNSSFKFPPPPPPLLGQDQASTFRQAQTDIEEVEKAVALHEDLVEGGRDFKAIPVELTQEPYYLDNMKARISWDRCPPLPLLSTCIQTTIGL